jgi:phi LC3 family holin
MGSCELKGEDNMKINWTVRMKNKVFWLAIIPALLMLIQAVADVFGFVIDFGELSNKLLAVVEAVFVILAMLGIVADPTTSGVSDSNQAMTYIEPKK